MLIVAFRNLATCSLPAPEFAIEFAEESRLTKEAADEFPQNEPAVGSAEGLPPQKDSLRISALLPARRYASITKARRVASLIAARRILKSSIGKPSVTCRQWRSGDSVSCA